MTFKPKEPTVTTSIRLSVDDLRQLDRIAKQYDCSRGEIIRWGVKKAIKMLPKKDKSSKVTSKPNKETSNG